MGEIPSEERGVPKLDESLKQLRRLLLLVRPFWGMLIRDASLSLLIGVIGMASPYISKLLIDHAYPARDLTLVNVLVGGGLALGIAAAVMSGIESYYKLNLNTRRINVTNLFYLNHLLHLPMRFFEEQRVGDVISRFTDVRQALQSISNIMQTVFMQGVFL